MKDYKIKKGDRFLCIKDFKMDDGEIAYVKGKEYVSDKNNHITDNEPDPNHKMKGLSNFFEHFLSINNPKFEGRIEKKVFYMVLVEGSPIAPRIKHDDYDVALNECVRLSKQEGKTAYVLKAVTEVEQSPNVSQLS